jgi:hypothetical protein
MNGPLALCTEAVGAMDEARKAPQITFAPENSSVLPLAPFRRFSIGWPRCSSRSAIRHHQRGRGAGITQSPGPLARFVGRQMFDERDHLSSLRASPPKPCASPPAALISSTSGTGLSAWRRLIARDIAFTRKLLSDGTACCPPHRSRESPSSESFAVPCVC